MTESPAPASASARPRLRELDVLRGLAALGVVLFHFTDHLDPTNVHPQPLPFRFALGMQGVQLFFMISGFVIFMTLEKTRRPMDFVVSRVSRLFPAYWVAIALTFTVVHMLGLPGEERTVREALLNLSMFQEFLRVPHVDDVYWTLQVEMLFYIAMLVLFRTGLLVNILPLLWLWLLMRVIWLGAKGLFGIDMSWTLGKLLILSYIPFFAMGIAFYLAYRDGHWTPQTCLTIAFAWLLVLWGDGATAAWCAAAFVALFALFVRGKLALIAVGPLVLLGYISYPLYLIHQNIGKAIVRNLYSLGLSSGLANATIAIVAVLAIAAAMTFLIEQPAMKWIRAHWKPSAARNGD